MRVGNVGAVEPAPPVEHPRREGRFPPEAFEQLATIESGHYWFESRNRLITWAIGRYFPGARTLLEIGCGTGFVLQGVHAAFPALRLTASDAMAGGLEVAGRRVPSAALLQQDARELDAAEQFDLVVAFDVLEHIPEDVQVMGRMFQAVRPGGGVIVTVPQHPQLWSRTDECARHVRRYRRRELVDRLQQTGFDIVRVTSFVSLLLPLMAASRWAAQREEHHTDREFVVSPMVNAALRAVLAVERGAIRLGASWPAGGSLLVVARKGGV